MLLKNKCVLITGANGALGRAVAARAAAFGASQLLLVDIDENIDASEITSQALDDDAKVPACRVEKYGVDLTDQRGVKTLFNALPHIDAVFNIAGGFDMGTSVIADDDEQWQAMFAINVTTLRNVLRACAPSMVAAGRGAIVNIGALGALQGQAQMSAYIAAKSTVMRLTESLSAELKEKGINVNAVLPNVIDTPRNRADMPDADTSRWVKPQDLANIICMLGSDFSTAMHGALIPVRGLD